MQIRHLIGIFGVFATLSLSACGPDTAGSAAASPRPGESVGDAGPVAQRSAGMQTSPDNSATVPPSNPNAPQAAPIGTGGNSTHY